jgi:SAM-dependent methyltransferase
MPNNFYSTLYEGVDDLNKFNASELKEYREALLERSCDEVEFILNFLNPIKNTILDIGCGNGRICFSMQKAGINLDYCGIDVAKSRIKFAEKWKEDLNANTAKFYNLDFLNEKIPVEITADMVLVLTVMISYFGYTNEMDLFFDRLKRYLKKGSKIIIEVYNRPKIRAEIENGESSCKLWTEFPSSDRYRFGLHEFSIKDKTVVDRKIFIKRDLNEIEDKRTEYVYVFDDGELESILNRHNFEVKGIYSDFKFSKYTSNRKDETKIIVAEYK